MGHVPRVILQSMGGAFVVAMRIYPVPSHKCILHISLVFFVMLPRRDSIGPNPSHASPHSTSGSFGGRRPLNLITNPKTFRATTAQTIESESPTSETAPQDTQTAPPMPPRSPVFPQLPPRNNGLRRQSTRHDTHESFSSALDFPFQSQPQNIVPMPALPPLRTPAPPHTPKRLRLPVHAESVGGFAMPPSPRHGPARGYSHQYTADYTYRFDTMPSPGSDSGSPHYEPADISGGIHADVWPTYNKISQEVDEKKLSKWNADLDVLLIFVSLVLGCGR